MAKSLIVTILGNATQFGAELDRAAGKTRALGKVAGVAGLAIAGGLALGLEKSVVAAMHAETETARLDAAFRSAGLGSTNYASAVSKAEESARKLGFTNEDVRGSLGSLIVATKNTGTAVKDLGVAEDLARFKHLSLADASKTLTMAMAGSQRAAHQLGIIISALTDHYDKLKASGIDLTTHTGHLTEAHAKLLDKMETGKAVIAAVSKLVSGQSAAYAGTAQGGMAVFHAQLVNLEESLGKGLIPAITAVVTELSVFASFLAAHTTLTKILVIGLAVLAGALMAISVATTIAAAAMTVFEIATAPVTLVILAVVAAVALLALAAYEIYKNWGAISGFFAKMWNDIKGVFDAAIGFVQAHWRAFAVGLATIIAGPLGALVVLIATHWATIKRDVEAAIGAIEGAVRSGWNAVKGAVEAAVGAIEGAVRAGWNAIKGAVSSAMDAIHGVEVRGWNEMKSAASAGIDKVISTVKALPGQIVAALGNLGRLLYNAGVSIIQGLIDGLKAKLGEVTSLVGSIAHKIASLKGPLDKDRVLLIPHGRAIIEGLRAGMEEALPGVYGLAASIAPNIGIATHPSATPSAINGGGGVTNVTVNVPNFVGSKTELASTVSTALMQVQARGGKVLLPVL